MAAETTAPKARWFHGARAILAAALLLGLLSAILRFGPASGPGGALIAALATGQRVGNAGWLRVADVEGDPWSDFTIGRIDIVDRQGPWLSARQVAVRWRPEALWTRTVKITQLSAGAVTLLRHPALLPPRPESPSPVSVQIDSASARLVLTPQFAWRRGDYLLDAALKIQRNNAVSGRGHAVSLLHPGDFLRFGFAFSHDAVALEAHAREALGGALAGSLGLDPDQPFGLDARVHGSPRAGWFSLMATVGRLIPAQASGQWTTSGGAASGRIDLASSRWLAPWRSRIGPEATLRLSASRSVGPLYRVAFEGRGANLAITAAGDLDPAHGRTGSNGLGVDLAVSDASALAGLRGLGEGRVSGLLSGDTHRWRLAGVATVDKIQVAGLELARAAGPFRLEAAQGVLTAHADVQGAGGSGRSPLATVLGAAPRASADVQQLADGRLLIRSLAVHGAALDVRGQGARGLLGDLSFKGQAQVHDLAAAAPGTRGRILADWTAAQASKAGATWTFTLRARGESLRLGSAEASSLLGAAPSFEADGRASAGGLLVDRALLRGAAATVTTAGSVSKAGELRLKIGWTGSGPLVVGPLSISGSSQGWGDLSGTIDRPQLTLLADFKVIDLPDLPTLSLRQARLALSLAGGDAAAHGHIELTAESANGPARGTAAFRLASGAAVLSDLDIAAGGASLRGGATLDGEAPSLADLTLTVGPGAFLDRGRIDGRLQISGSSEGPRARVSLKAADLLFPGGATALRTLAVSANGPLQRLPYQIEARGESGGLPARLSGNGLMTDVVGGRSLSFAGSGRVDAVDIRTLAPARIVLRRAGLEGDLHLSIAGGRADVRVARDGAGLTARAVATGIDLAVLDPDIRGRADGVLHASSGAGGAIVGGVEAKISDVRGRDMDAAAPMAGALNATFGGGEIESNTVLTDTRGSRVSAEIRLPARVSAAPLQFAVDLHGPMTGRFSADGEIGPLWDLIEGGGRSLSGRLVGEGTIGGTLADPRLTGTASIAGGDFEDAGVGLSLKNLALRADLRGDAIDVGQFAAADGAKGALSGSGRLSLLRGGASGFRLNLKAFRLIDTSLVQATASGTVNVDRAADGKVRLAGALVIDRAQISPTPPTPSGVVPMDVVEVHGAAEAPVAIAAASERDPPIALDIGLTSPAGIFIKGRGLNMEMSLDAKVIGSTAAPALSGVARVVRGDYDFAGKRFQIADSGAVYLGSTPQTIRLDISATRDDPTLTAVIKIQGTAAAPTLTLSSTPALPQDEVLSQVLFGASASQLSGLEAAQLASALAGLAKGGGFDVIGNLRNFAHLDRLAVDSGATTGFTVAGGKYLTDKVYLELSGGARIGQGAQVEWRVKKHVAVVSRVTSQGDHAVSIRWRKDY